MSDDQREAIAFLGDPASYGGDIGPVETVETHASFVFLAGDRAYKLKRAVKLPYLDFSTAELRRQACAAELALNRRTAPAIYLELRALTRDAAGRIGFCKRSPAVDWVVVMRRFDRHLVFEALAEAGGLTPAIIDELADHIAAFHATAEPRPEFGGAAEIGEIAEINHRCLAAARRAGFAAERIATLHEQWRGGLAGVGPLLEARRRDGKVRRCHGDLHLRNICLCDGRPTLFDCLEFSEALASIDILYDLAFLLMDIEHRGLGGLANRGLNRYLDRTGEDRGLAALPLFLSLRAGIRAHVTATALDERDGDETEGDDPGMAAEARAYLDLAHRVLEPAPPRLVAIGGLSGTGKSTLAAALAPELGRRPGARVLRSDVIRKVLAGVAPETRLPASAYTPPASARVYKALREKARAALAAGYAVVLDAVALLPEERRGFAEIAAAAQVPFTGLWLEAPASAMAERIAARARDASDATAAVVEQQLARDPGPIGWTQLAAGDEPLQTLAAARAALAPG